MKVYDIWSEGYRATGEHGTAHHHGCAEGKTFRAACINFFDSSNEYFNKDKLAYWGCRLFDNQADARDKYG